MTSFVQVDPMDCGCTECITGEYLPANYINKENFLHALKNTARNASGEELVVTLYLKSYSGFSDSNSLRGTVEFAGESFFLDVYSSLPTPGDLADYVEDWLTLDTDNPKIILKANNFLEWDSVDLSELDSSDAAKVSEHLGIE